MGGWFVLVMAIGVAALSNRRVIGAFLLTIGLIEAAFAVFNVAIGDGPVWLALLPLGYWVVIVAVMALIVGLRWLVRWRLPKKAR